MNRSSLFPMLVLFLAPAGVKAFDAVEKRPEAQFQEGWYREIAEGRIEEALGIYQRLAERADIPREIRARAWLRLGICRTKLGRKQEGREALERVRKEFADIDDASRAARLEIEGETESEASFRIKVEGLTARLGEKGLEETVQTENGSRKIRNPVVESIEGIGPRAAPYLFPALGKNDFYTSENAAEILVRFANQEPELQPKLIAALRSGDAIVKKSIGQALERNFKASWMPLLGALSADADAEIRGAAIRALQRAILKSKSSSQADPDALKAAIEAMRKAASDPVAELRSEAIKTLGLLGENAPLEVLAAAFRDEAAAVRKTAVEAWSRAAQASRRGEGFDPRGVIDLLADPSLEVATAAIDALAVFNGKVEKGKGARLLFQGGAEATVSKLAALAGNRELQARTRQSAIEILAMAELQAASPTLRAIIQSADPVTLPKAVSAALSLNDQAVIPDLLKLLYSPERPGAKDPIWGALTDGKFFSPAVLKSLIENLDRLGPLASAALSTFNHHERRDLVIAALRHYEAVDTDARIILLSTLQAGILNTRNPVPEAVAALRKSLDDPKPEVRKAGLHAAANNVDVSLYPALLESLQDPDSDTRALALNALDRLADARAVPRLLEILRDRAPQNVHQARNLLLRIAGRENLDALLAMLREDANLVYPLELKLLVERLARPEDASRIAAAIASMRPDVRLEMIPLLGQLKNPEVFDFLRARLGDADARMRKAAIDALAAIPHPGVPEALIGALQDGDALVRSAVLQSLNQLDAARILAFPRAIDSLAACLEDGSWEVRQAAAATLARLKDSRTVPILIRALRDGDSRSAPCPLPTQPGPGRIPPRRPVPGNPAKQRMTIADIAAEALEEFGGKEIVGPLLEILSQQEETNPWIRVEAVLEAIERQADAGQSLQIALALDRVSPSARPRLIDLLGGFSKQEAVPALQKRLEDGEAGTRQHAILALGKLGGDAALASIIGSLGDEAPEARSQAADSLTRFKNEAAFQALLGALQKEGDPKVQEKIFQALEKSADPRAIPVLLAGLRERLPAHALATLMAYPRDPAIQALGSVLSNDGFSAGLKEEAFRVLSLFPDNRALDLVLAGLGRAEERLRRKAAEALGHFQDPRALPRLVEALRDPDDDVRKAAKKSIDEIRYYQEQKAYSLRPTGGGEAAAGELLKMLGSDKEEVRLSAIRALGRLRAQEALANLVRLRKDPAEAIRKAVEEALDEISGEKK